MGRVSLTSQFTIDKSTDYGKLKTSLVENFEYFVETQFLTI